jgi:hypothetical protein
MPTMFVATAIRPATSLVSAQMRPITVPATSMATIAASQYRIRRLVMVREPTLIGAFGKSKRQALLGARKAQHRSERRARGHRRPEVRVDRQQDAAEHEHRAESA